MKRLITTLLLIATFVFVPVVSAEETVKCTSTQYGEATCGVSTSTDVVVEHNYQAGFADLELVSFAVFAIISAVFSTYLFRKSYHWYILG